MGLLDELLMAETRKRNLMMQGTSPRVGGQLTQMVARPNQIPLREQFPTFYGALGGLLGMEPDSMEGSILDPNTAAVRQGAGYGYPAGLALQALPMVAPAASGAKVVGKFVAPKAGQLAENYMQRMGMMPSIVPLDIARKIDMPANLPKSKEFITAVQNEPSARITDEGLLMRLRRMQSPEQSGSESVRTGVFYLPESQASNLKHYKGKSGYGGAESIDGETLYKNPLFVKGATGGKAPENAYDLLSGKGAYQSMRNDVLNSYGYNSNQSQKVESVQGLLEKYNGLDPDDAYNMAYNIVNNSKGGNTLPYAIQENIVANAVRNAGHDAVLGYGKGRGDKKEFFSEVFDVREATYPTPQGGFELMPQFEGLLK